MIYNREITDQEREYLSAEITALPDGREELIFAYSLRFLPMALDEYTDYSEIETIEKADGLIRKWGIQDKVLQAQGDKERTKAVLYSILRNNDIQEEVVNLVMEYSNIRATEFVTSKRNRLRAKALLLMGEEQLNKRELAYLRGEGEFWYNETEEE